MITANKEYTTVEEYHSFDKEMVDLFKERLILGFNYGSCDTILSYGNHGYSSLYVYGITHEEYPILEQELSKALGKHVEAIVRNKNEKYVNVLVHLTYREVFNGPLVQNWYEEALTAGKIIYEHGGWLMRGLNPKPREGWDLPHMTEYWNKYQLQLKELGFPTWS